MIYTPIVPQKGNWTVTNYNYPYAPNLETPVVVYPLTEEGINYIPNEIVHGNYIIAYG